MYSVSCVLNIGIVLFLYYFKTIIHQHLLYRRYNLYFIDDIFTSLNISCNCISKIFSFNLFFFKKYSCVVNPYYQSVPTFTVSGPSDGGGGGGGGGGGVVVAVMTVLPGTAPS